MKFMPALRTTAVAAVLGVSGLANAATLLVVGSVVITIATWYMEFRSATVRALSNDAHAPAPPRGQAAPDG